MRAATAADAPAGGEEQTEGQAGGPVSTLELFFDLVFVFTVTQLTGLIAHPSGALAYVQASLILLMVWWMYSGYIWLTSNVGTEAALHRLLIFGGMGGFLTMALSIPAAFGGSAGLFGAGYLLVTLIHAGLFLAAPNSSARAIQGIFGYNLAAALLVLAAAFFPGGRLWLWAAAIAVLLLSGWLRRESGFQLRPAHFAERHGLILMIALGESVVAIGAGVGGAALTPTLLLGALLALALNFALWWSYFDADAHRASGVLERLPVAERAQLALRAFGFGHVLMIAGVIGVAAGVKLTLGGLSAHGAAPGALIAWSLGGGAALFLLGDVLFRHVSGLGRAWPRLLCAVLALGTALAGQRAGGLVQMSLLTALLAALLLLEARYHAPAAAHA